MEFETVYRKDSVLYLIKRDPSHAKAGFCVTYPGQLAGKEGVHWLNTNMLQDIPLPERDISYIRAGRARAVNLLHPAANRLTGEDERKAKGKKRVHILALGDVGATLLLGLRLLGGDAVSEIGVFDPTEAVSERYEREMNQTLPPFMYDAMPEVRILEKHRLFSCDVFIFCASAGVPKIGADVPDVRMAQFHSNMRILKEYARMARDARFAGLFAVMSDPVDLLCRYAYLESNRNEAGKTDHLGLLAEQIRGYGLGVMNARAAYYAKKDARLSAFLLEGRAYGPHGRGVVIANSIVNYDEALSLELTQKTEEANLEVRALGFKPYIAPALSSGALSILPALRGEWHYGAVALGGVYFGCKNRETQYGLETEALPLPGALYGRLQLSCDMLKGWEREMK
ncbi:MAG TPA: lactate dehydrogenase [Feifaniaceae bacterium]|nr:lactate dehydrogenase [Feifaniaceae bacterium]